MARRKVLAIAHRLADGTEYFGGLGRLAYDEAEDKVQMFGNRGIYHKGWSGHRGSVPGGWTSAAGG